MFIIDRKSHQRKLEVALRRFRRVERRLRAEKRDIGDQIEEIKCSMPIDILKLLDTQMPNPDIDTCI